MAHVELVTLGDRTKDGPLVIGSAFDGANTPINQKIKALELEQPEGTLMELRITFPPITVPVVGTTVTWAADRFAQHAADQLNAQYQAGQLKDPSSGEPLKVWPAPFQYPVAVADGRTLILRWVKLQAFAYILVGLLLSLLGYVVFKYLQGSSWSLLGSRSSTQPNPVPGGGPPRFLGIPWYYWAAGVVVVGVPVGYWYVADVDRHRLEYVRDRAQIRRLEEES